MSRVKNILRTWCPLAVAVVFLSATVYGVAQQFLRISANNPQIQMAEDAARAIENGSLAATIVPSTPVDIGASLAPFLVIYDDTGKPIASSGVLRNQSPALPSGVFQHVRRSGEDRISWEPEQGLRIAAVVTRIEGSSQGFVLAGRSLRETEALIWQIGQIAVLFCLVTLVASLVTAAAAEFLLS